MIVLAVTWIAKPGKAEEAAALFRTLTEQSRKEPGCLMYQVHRHKNDRARFFIYEQYRDEAALEAHRNSPHFLEYARSRLPKIAERKEGELYDPF
jgi:quinol monooxygenase YgiN